MIVNASFHRRRYAQRFMNPAKVVVHVEQADRVHVVFQLLTEAVG